MGRLLDTYRALSMASKLSSGSAHDPSPLQEIEYLYRILGVLDTKASALMRFDAILIAASSFLLSERVQFANHIPASRLILVTILMLSLVAAALCLFVVQISYPFLGKVNLQSNQINCNSELIALDTAHEFRTACYRWAWALSLLAILLFLLLGLLIAFPMADAT